MKILLDHCVPTALAKQLPDHDVEIAYDRGWQSIVNGKLLTLAEESGFEILLTTDKKMRFQQNIAGKQIALLVVDTMTGTVPEVLGLVPKIQSALQMARKGTVVIVSNTSNH